MNRYLGKSFLRVHRLGGQENLEREPPIGPGWVALGSLLLLAFLILLFHIEITVRHTDREVFTFDSAEYAIAGRQLSRTGVLSTTFVHPDALYGRKSPPFPYIVGHPMVPVLNGAMFLIGGERPALTLIPPGLFYLLLVSLAAAFAFRLSRSRGLALCVGCAIAFHPTVLHYASEGLSEMPFTAAWIGAVFLLWQMRQRPHPFVLGLLLGAAHFTRPMIAPLLPLWLTAAALMASGRRWRVIGSVLAGFLPWAAILVLYRFMATGDPMADIGPSRLLAYLAPEFAPYQLHRYVDAPSPLAYLSAHPQAFIGKILRFGPKMLWGAFMVGDFIGILFLIHLLSPAKRSEDKIFRVSLVSFIIVLVGLVTITVPSRRYFFPLLPLFLILGLSELYFMMRARGLRGSHTIGICAAIVVIVSALPTGQSWMDAWRRGEPDRGAFTESEWTDFGDCLRRVLPEHAMVTSDVAPWLTWYADRPSVLLPATPIQFDALEKPLAIDAIVLTSEWLLEQPGNEEWRALFLGQKIREHWVRADSISIGSGKAVILFPTRENRGI